MKSLTSVAHLAQGDLERLIARAIGFAQGSEEPACNLYGETVGTVFFEPSTRTRLSFELAARRLGAEIVSFELAGSSASKGESEKDTVLTVAAMGPQILVVRHYADGFPEQVMEWTGRAVVNAGDGRNEHPTQALLDAVTLMRRFGKIDGLTVAVVGDIAHSRVAGSLMKLMPALGADLVLAGPSELLPEAPRFAVAEGLDDLIGNVDVIYLLRVQRERGADTDEGYHDRWGLDGVRAARMRPEAVVMHPGPINRGVEISDDVADGPRSLILDQVANGVPTRMAVLAEIAETLG
jgi:aspartate carbamoyltransferase catalytic subunit